MKPTSTEAAICCMIVSNPCGGMQPHGWQKRVNDLIRAQDQELTTLRAEQAMLKFDIDKMLTQIEGHNAAWDELRASEAAANARADQARDKALLEAAGTLEAQALDAEAQAKRFRGGSDPWADRTARSRALRNSADTILALRDKPAPAVTVDAVVSNPLMQEQFADWFRRNYPSPDTIIGDPDWHAPRILNAAIWFINNPKKPRAIAGGGDE